MSHPIRCLLGMLGTDVHSKGIRTLAFLLRERGVEVIYLGEHNTVPGMVAAIEQEDPDVVGLSFSSGGYVDYTGQLIGAMRAAGLGDIPVMLGGQIHPDDRPALDAMGVAGSFGPGTGIDDVMAFLGSLPARGRG